MCDTLDTDKVDKETGKGLSTNDYTTAEKTKLSALTEFTSKTTMDSVATINTEYFLGTQSSVSITLPSTSLTRGDMIIVIFYSGSTATSLSVSGSTVGTVPTPTTNQRVELNFEYDGTYWSLLSSTASTT